jgi:hypothetical protein
LPCFKLAETEAGVADVISQEWQCLSLKTL